MSEYRSNVSLAEAARRIAGASRIAVTTHAKPDGDAFGSVGAMVAALRTRQPQTQVTGWLMPPIPEGFRTLAAWPLVREFEQGDAIGEPREPDLVLVLDTGAWAQLGPMRPLLEPLTDRMLIVDHHISGDVEAAWKYIDSTAAACCTVVAELLDVMVGVSANDVPCHGGADPNALIRDFTIAEALFAGVASDTGWFRFSNTTARTHRLAARLIEAGVDHADLYTRLEQSERPEKLTLQMRAMQSLKLLADGQLAVMVLRAEDFRETGASIAETERFVDIPQSVASVKTVALITEPPEEEGDDGKPAVRISFRSKPTPDAVNVAKLAERFGGGGHARAAGAKLDAPLEEVVRQIEAAAMDLVAKAE